MALPSSTKTDFMLDCLHRFCKERGEVKNMDSGRFDTHKSPTQYQMQHEILVRKWLGIYKEIIKKFMYFTIFKE